MTQTPFDRLERAHQKQQQELSDMVRDIMANPSSPESRIVKLPTPEELADIMKGGTREQVLRKMWRVATEQPDKVWSSADIILLMQYLMCYRAYMSRVCGGYPSIDEDGKAEL